MEVSFLKKNFSDLILSCYNAPQFHWNNLQHPSIWPHIFMCSHLWVWVSKSTTRNGSYPSTSNPRDHLPRFFHCRTRGEPLGSLCLTCWTHKKFTEIGLNQHFRKLFNLMLNTPGNGKFTASPRAALTQRNWLVFQSSHFNFQLSDSYCGFDLKIW